MPLAAAFAQAEAAYVPKNGKTASQCGGGGSWKAAKEAPQPAMRSKCCVIVAIASQNGSTKITSSAMVITATASPRLCQSRSWTCTMMGQVATTSVVAQMIAGRKGHNIQNEAAISPPTKRTAR